MKKAIVVVLSVFLIITTGLFSLSAVGARGDKADISVPPANVNLVTAARFQNMLDNNYVYSEDFGSVSKILYESQLSLLNLADDDGLLKNSDLADFVYNMYGLDVTVFADEGKNPLDKSGTTYITPRGYTKYTHEIVETVTNEDGTVVVYTKVNADLHDDEDINYQAVAFFAPNADSAFGYNLLFCNLIMPIDAI